MADPPPRFSPHAKVTIATSGDNDGRPGYKLYEIDFNAPGIVALQRE
jgi:hypothetical protein